MNARLTTIFTSEEVDQALGQMHHLKSPGPDGFGESFFQKHWQIVGDEVRKAVLDFLNFGVFD
jgi:xylose isomerase